MRFWIPLLLVAFLGLPALASEPGVASFSDPPAVTAEQPTEAKSGEKVTLKRGLGLIERRKMGLTFRNVRRVLAEMNDAGELDGRDTAVVAALVLEQLSVEKPMAFAGLDEDFWERLLAFLEAIIPIILKFLPFLL